MKTTFTKEEIKLMNNAMQNVASDMREIYKMCSLDEIRIDIDAKHHLYGLNIKKNCIIAGPYYLSTGGERLEICLPNGKSIYPKIKDKDFVFNFLRDYESIRKKILEMVKRRESIKDAGIAQIAALNNKYSKGVVLQVETPETINQSSVVVTNENGQNIGYIKIGSTTIKIFASSNVKIVGNEPQKVKEKRRKG